MIQCNTLRVHVRQARFVRVTSKLTPAAGRWTVAVVLEDSSGAQLNVQLSNEVWNVHTH